ncbi:MAG: putative toxin-antitoxin system toxin component, PIN family [Candidatus Margulisiibacteriota bacterium]|jgi:putative PIN family toxin of toxin-antitoxin system
MKIVINTNVLVSAILSPYGVSAKVLSLVLNKKIKLVLDARISAEYEDVLQRSKFGLEKKKVKIILDHIHDLAEKVMPSPVNTAMPDPDDKMFYEAALSGKTDHLITGNKKHFPKTLCKGVQVSSPQEFLEIYFK